MPGDDPKQKWIVFLRVDEDGRPAAEVKPGPGPQWYVKHDAATAEAIRTALLLAEWGPVQDGLQMGLRLRQGTAAVGQSAAPKTPAPGGVYGKVTAVATAGTLAQVNIGSDSGLAAGNTLIVFRESEYLGGLTLTVVNTKEAVGKFTPARRGATIREGLPGVLAAGKAKRGGWPAGGRRGDDPECLHRSRTFEQHRMNIYDYWPGTTFRVTAPGGFTTGCRRSPHNS